MRYLSVQIEQLFITMRTSMMSLFLILLSGCSLSTVIQKSATDYNAAAAAYNDQVLLYTFLRARDEAPINMLALSSINGAASFQAGVGGSVSGTNLTGASPAHGVVGVISPVLQYSASPTFSMASLNTQGFTVGLIQPISPMYVASKWTSGLDRQFLLRLFVKSIKVRSNDNYVEYLNDARSAAGIRRFNELIARWTPRMSVRTLTVLEPLGPPLNTALSAVTSIASTGSVGGANSVSESYRAGVSYSQSGTLLGAYQYLMPLDGGPFHVGNVTRPGSNEPLLQLFREYPQQVVLCVDAATLLSRNTTGSTSQEEQREELYAINEYAFAIKAAARNAASANRATTPATDVSNGNSKTPTPSGYRPSLSSNLRVDRVAAILPESACRADEILLPAASEARAASLSGDVFSHVEWRSIAEVIEYLGALLRVNIAEEDGSWLESSSLGKTVRHITFRLAQGDMTGFASIDYRGIRYVIGPDEPPTPYTVRDHSLQAMAIVNELISATKVSGDLPTTPSIQVLP